MRRSLHFDAEACGSRSTSSVASPARSAATAKTMLRLHLERETRARDQHRHKQVHHAARKADVHVVERNHHATMRRRDEKSKSRMNRSLAEAGPAMTVQLLRDQCERHGKHLIEAPAPYNSRTRAACGSRETKLTRARIACAGCGHTADRDANAAANALNWARTNGAVPAPGGSNREVSARRGSSRAPQCPVPPESLGPATALARREPGKLPGQDADDARLQHEFWPRAIRGMLRRSGRWLRRSFRSPGRVPPVIGRIRVERTNSVRLDGVSSAAAVF